MRVYFVSKGIEKKAIHPVFCRRTNRMCVYEKELIEVDFANNIVVYHRIQKIP